MAPKQLKRPAAATESAPAKKGKTAGIGKKCKEIADALKSAKAYPDHVVKMLGENLAHSLGDVKEDRHEFQVKVNGMVAEVLGSVEAGIQEDIAAAQAKVAASDTEKAAREGALEAAKTTLETKQAELAAADKALEEAEAEVTATTKALKAAEKDQKAGDADVLANEEKKTKLQKVVAESFQPAKEGTVAGSLKTAIAEVAKLGKENHFDAALLSSLPSALGKEPSARGSFDETVVNQIANEFKEIETKLNTLLTEAAPAKEARQAKVTEAAATAAAAATKKASCEEAAKAAKSAEKEAIAAQKEAQKAVKSLGPEMKEVASSLAEATESLAEFQEGPMAVFKELLEKSKVVPEPAVEEAPAAVEATA
eukprot:CAMPEP_0197649992 /NCGR_PEP_ID=MMETSP1338-20131121/30678_1 /TAXON_ID=43686 ORGANISM="Pelagodinium beii, Strain RCC1491" /NCGR_SAMPLE_ID=MMETSP1338 /ASSEMBLY_ACC=CAM_ASM_000754 /LENGTH=367 /DNA_ID=CAMNT_0043224325 /DNA_START=54 /DNA_END=1157 /DNA_ORIENTATION=-